MTENGSKAGTVSPFISPDTPMLAEILLRLDDCAGLSPSRRRDLKSALRAIARLIGKPLETTPANINWLQVRLRRVHPAARGISQKRFSNVKSDALKALAITGCSRERADWLSRPSSGWARLLDAVADKHDRWKLSQFAQYCSCLRVEPGRVTDRHVHDFLNVLVEESFQNRPEHVVANTIKTWNRLRDQINGWPDVGLSPLPPKKPRWTFPVEAFPESFRGDIGSWLDRLANPDLFDISGPAKPLRPRTIAHRRFQILEAASALVHSGRPIEEVTGLDVLVDLANLKAALRWMMQRFGGKSTEAIQGVAVCLQAIARHHVRIGGDDLAEIKGIVRRLGRDADGLREKNRQRLLQLEDPLNLTKLVHLPAALVSKAQRLNGAKPRKAALLLQAALAIEILLNAPMRVGNLAALHLERHLRQIGSGRKRETHIHIPADEVKNGKTLDHLLNAEVTALLELYLAEARPILLRDPSDYLFPAMDGGPKATTGLSRLIKETIRAHTGLEIHAHLFRSIAGKIHSLAQPGDAVTLSYLLNDSLGTVLKSYTPFERRAALEHYQRSLASARRIDHP